MCGIIGLITPQGHKPSKLDGFLEQALFCDTLRGHDSTGMFVVDGKNPKRDARYYKQAVAAPEFLTMPQASEILRRAGMADTMAAIGHNRAATRGSIQNENAHPFQHDGVTLVHNGTLYGRWDLPAQRTDFAVDSEAVCWNIANHGVDATIEGIWGSFALVWHDASDGTVNIVRNDQRPLMLALLSDDAGYALASEGGMLRWLLQRNKIEFDKTLWTYKPGTLATFRRTKKGKLELTTRTLKLHEPKAYQTGWGAVRRSPFRRQETTTTGTGNIGPQRPLDAKLAEQRKASLQQKAETPKGLYGDKAFDFLGWKKGQLILGYYQGLGAVNGEITLTQNVHLLGWNDSCDDFVQLLCTELTQKRARQWDECSGTYAAALLTPSYAYSAHSSASGKVEHRVVCKLHRLLTDEETRAFEEMDMPGAMGDPTAGLTEPEKETPKFIPPDNSKAWWEDEDGNIFVKGPRGDYVSLRDFNDYVSGGCSAGCSKVLTRSDANSIVWVSDFPFCQTCYSDDEVRAALGFTDMSAARQPADMH